LKNRLTRSSQTKRLRAVFRPDTVRSYTNSTALLALAAFSLTLLAAGAAPFNQATVTKVENRVEFGTVKGTRSEKRRASASDILRANNFLLTETESRAELQYEDGSVVRIGQNTVFSFDAGSRTLTLDKGSLIFYIPKGAGGGQIKTPSLTAAITGTVGKVSVNSIAILEGQVRLLPSGRNVGAGYVGRVNADGSISVRPFDMSRAGEGRLMVLNGPMPGFKPQLTGGGPHLTLDLSQLDTIRMLEIGTNLPGSIAHFFPDIDRSKTTVKVPSRNDRGTPGDGGGKPY
jgi:hypothetical protein